MILVLVMVLQVTVTVRHQTSAGKRPTSLKCPQLQAPVAECPPRCQQTNYAPLCHKGGENVAARDQNYSATVQTSASSMVVTYLSVLQVCRLFMHLRTGVCVFFQLLGFIVIILILNVFSLVPMFFLNRHIEL